MNLSKLYDHHFDYCHNCHGVICKKKNFSSHTLKCQSKIMFIFHIYRFSLIEERNNEGEDKKDKHKYYFALGLNLNKEVFYAVPSGFECRKCNKGFNKHEIVPHTEYCFGLADEGVNYVTKYSHYGHRTSDDDKNLRGRLGSRNVSQMIEFITFEDIVKDSSGEVKKELQSRFNELNDWSERWIKSNLDKDLLIKSEDLKKIDLIDFFVNGSSEINKILDSIVEKLSMLSPVDLRIIPMKCSEYIRCKSLLNLSKAKDKYINLIKNGTNIKEEWEKKDDEEGIDEDIKDYIVLLLMVARSILLTKKDAHGCFYEKEREFEKEFTIDEKEEADDERKEEEEYFENICLDFFIPFLSEWICPLKTYHSEQEWVMINYKNLTKEDKNVIFNYESLIPFFNSENANIYSESSIIQPLLQEMEIIQKRRNEMEDMDEDNNEGNEFNNIFNNNSEKRLSKAEIIREQNRILEKSCNERGNFNSLSYFIVGKGRIRGDFQKFATGVGIVITCYLLKHIGAWKTNNRTKYRIDDLTLKLGLKLLKLIINNRWIGVLAMGLKEYYTNHFLSLSDDNNIVNIITHLVISQLILLNMINNKTEKKLKDGIGNAVYIACYNYDNNVIYKRRYVRNDVDESVRDEHIYDNLYCHDNKRITDYYYYSIFLKNRMISNTSPFLLPLFTKISEESTSELSKFPQIYSAVNPTTVIAEKEYYDLDIFIELKYPFIKEKLYDVYDIIMDSSEAEGIKYKDNKNYARCLFSSILPALELYGQNGALLDIIKMDKENILYDLINSSFLSVLGGLMEFVYNDKTFLESKRKFMLSNMRKSFRDKRKERNNNKNKEEEEEEEEEEEMIIEKESKKELDETMEKEIENLRNSENNREGKYKEISQDEENLIKKEIKDRYYGSIINLTDVPMLGRYGRNNDSYIFTPFILSDAEVLEIDEENSNEEDILDFLDSSTSLMFHHHYLTVDIIDMIINKARRMLLKLTLLKNNNKEVKNILSFLSNLFIISKGKDLQNEKRLVFSLKIFLNSLIYMLKTFNLYHVKPKEIVADNEMKMFNNFNKDRKVYQSCYELMVFMLDLVKDREIKVGEIQISNYLTVKLSLFGKELFNLLFEVSLKLKDKEKCLEMMNYCISLFKCLKEIHQSDAFKQISYFILLFFRDPLYDSLSHLFTWKGLSENARIVSRLIYLINNRKNIFYPNKCELDQTINEETDKNERDKLLFPISILSNELEKAILDSSEERFKNKKRIILYSLNHLKISDEPLYCSFLYSRQNFDVFKEFYQKEFYKIPTLKEIFTSPDSQYFKHNPYAYKPFTYNYHVLVRVDTAADIDSSESLKDKRRGRRVFCMRCYKLFETIHVNVLQEECKKGKINWENNNLFILVSRKEDYDKNKFMEVYLKSEAFNLCVFTHPYTMFLANDDKGKVDTDYFKKSSTFKNIEDSVICSSHTDHLEDEYKDEYTKLDGSTNSMRSLYFDNISKENEEEYYEQISEDNEEAKIEINVPLKGYRDLNFETFLNSSYHSSSAQEQKEELIRIFGGRMFWKVYFLSHLKAFPLLFWKEGLASSPCSSYSNSVHIGGKACKGKLNPLFSSWMNGDCYSQENNFLVQGEAPVVNSQLLLSNMEIMCEREKEDMTVVPGFPLQNLSVSSLDSKNIDSPDCVYICDPREVNIDHCNYCDGVIGQVVMVEVFCQDNMFFSKSYVGQLIKFIKIVMDNQRSRGEMYGIQSSPSFFRLLHAERDPDYPKGMYKISYMAEMEMSKGGFMLKRLLLLQDLVFLGIKTINPPYCENNIVKSFVPFEEETVHHGSKSIVYNYHNCFHKEENKEDPIMKNFREIFERNIEKEEEVPMLRNKLNVKVN